MTQKKVPLTEADLVHMSEVALDLAHVAQESGRLVLANIFRMAALEASTVKLDTLRREDAFPHEPTTH
jgi:hypothetical protein